MTIPVGALVSFLPDVLIEELERARSLPNSPVARTVPAAVLFADITGFTTTTEDLTVRGPEGAELVTEYLESVFDPLLGAIATYGGDVLGFSGDSITALWRPPDSEDDGGDLEESVSAAAACGLEMQRAVGSMSHAVAERIQLTVAIGAGDALFLQLGGHRDRWNFVVAGSAMKQVERTHRQAQPGDVVLSDEAGRLAGHRVRATTTDAGEHQVVAVTEPARQPAASPRKVVTEDTLSLLQSYVPDPALSSLDTGELRVISAVFVNLLGLDVTRERDRDALNGAVISIQHILDRYAGTFLRLAAEDKGLTIAAAFGLPPHANEEDAARAAQASMEVEAALRGMRIEYGIGIATGPAYCGTYGSDVHREFTAMGSVMNLAARLMQSSKNTVSAEGATVKAAGTRIRFSEQPAVTAKGFSDPVATFRPLWEEDATQRRLAVLAEHARTTIVGREQERRVLADHLGGLESGVSSAVVLEGEAGIGKSILLAELIKTAGSRPVQAFFGAGDAVERNTPYHAWNSVFEQLLELDRVVETGARKARVVERLQAWPDMVELAPLLNSVVDLGFDENEATRDLTGTMRRDGLFDLAMRLLADAAASSPLLIVIDDAHWIDSASWELVRRARRSIEPLMLVLATWPSEERLELSELLAMPDAVLLPIGRMSSEVALDLVRQKLGVDALPESVAALITEKAEGHPFFSEEIAYSLRDQGAIAIEDGTLMLAEDPTRVTAVDVPDTVHGVITSRLSRLKPDESRTLKVASVLGPRFSINVLRAVHPVELTISELQGQLESLEELGLISVEPDGSAAFRHSIIHSVAYDMSERRRAVHADVAAWYEANHGEEDWAYSVIAHHWEGAEQPVRALPFLELSGTAALDQGASPEAAYFFARVIEVGGIEDDPRRWAHWHTQLGQARAEMGDLLGAEDAYYRALDLLGVVVPRSAVGRIARIGWESLVQAGHLLFGSGRRGSTREPAEPVAQAARVCSLIGELYYFTADLIGFPLLNLMSINRAERSGRPPSAGLAYSSLSYMAGAMRLHRLERRYNQMARDAEQQASEEAADNRFIVPLTPGHKVAAANSRASYLLALNRWDDALETVDAGIETCRKLRDYYTLEIGLAIRGLAEYCVSPVEEADGDVSELLTSARDRSNAQHEAWALNLGMLILLRQDRVDEALEYARRAEPLIKQAEDDRQRRRRGRDRSEQDDRRPPAADPISVPLFFAGRSLTRLRAGDEPAAVADAERALATFGAAPIFGNIAGLQATLETFSRVWADGASGDQVDPKRVRRGMRRGVGMMTSFALVFPFGRPTRALYKGRQQWLMGRSRRARRIWKRGLKQAEQAGLVWDEARIRRQLGEAMPADDPARNEQMAAARALFRRLGAVEELAAMDRVA